MNILAGWQHILRKAWSVRLALLSALLSAAEVAVQLLATVSPRPWFAMAAAATSLAAAIARVVAQPQLAQPDTQALRESMREALGLLPTPPRPLEPDVHARLQRLLKP